MTNAKKITPAEVIVEKSGEISKEIVAQDNQIVNVGNLIAQAIEQKLPVETMERFFALAEKMQGIKAKQEFDRAMAKFQSECPTIEKTKAVHTQSGALAYKYAPIESIIQQVKTPLQENGFSYSTQQEMLENGVKIVVKVTHIMGHSEVTEMTVPLGAQTKVMNNSQVVAAASTFAKRYAFLNAFGIMTGDEDSDGVVAEKDGEVKEVSSEIAPSEKQLALIESLMSQKGITPERMYDEGFDLKNLTGGKEGTASEAINFLFKFSSFTNGLTPLTDSEKAKGMFIKDLEACTTPDMYAKVANEIKLAKENGKLDPIDYDIVLKVAKQIVDKIKGS